MVDIEKVREEVEKIIKEYPPITKFYDWILNPDNKIEIPKSEKEFEKIKEESKFFNINDCYECDKLHNNLVYRPPYAIQKTFWGTGKCEKGIMFILQNPGLNVQPINDVLIGTVRTGVSCIGRGAILRWVANLGEHNFDRDIYTTNAVKCCTRNNKMNSKIQEICCHHLKDQIKKIKPKKIAILGETAQKSFDKIKGDIDLQNIITERFYHYSHAVRRSHIIKPGKGKEGLIDWIVDVVSFISD